MRGSAPAMTTCRCEVALRLQRWSTLEGALGNRPFAFFLAGVAKAVNLEGVAAGEVFVFAADFALDTLNAGGEEFHRTAAFGAYHVMVIAPVVLVFVARNAVVEGHLAGQSAFRQ